MELEINLGNSGKCLSEERHEYLKRKEDLLKELLGKFSSFQFQKGRLLNIVSKGFEENPWRITHFRLLQNELMPISHADFDIDKACRIVDFPKGEFKIEGIER